MVRRAWACALLSLSLALAGGAACAQTQASRSADFQTALWAASCMACHGTDGRAESIALSIAGRPADELYQMMADYKSGKRAGTIMHQHVRGYSDDELRRIARHYAQLAK